MNAEARFAPWMLAALTASAVGLAAGCAGTPRPPCSTEGPIATVCGFRNPEDLEYVERAGVVLVTNMRLDEGRNRGGFVSAYVPGDSSVHVVWPNDNDQLAEADPTLGDPACREAPDPASFYPHGLTSRSGRDRTLVFVTAHAGKNGGREAVEIFTLTGTGVDAQLVWKACIPTPGAIQANDVAVGLDGTVVVSDYQASASLRHLILASLLGTDTGDVLLWRSGSGWHDVPGTEASFANGVALSRDGTKIFFSETMRGLVHRVPIEGGRGAVSVPVEGNPDNLTWTNRGTLLVASHTAARAFGWCVFGHRPCKTSWAVFEIDPDTMAVNRVLGHDGSLIGAVSTALQVGDKLMLGSVFDDRIGVIDVHG